MGPVVYTIMSAPASPPNSPPEAPVPGGAVSPWAWGFGILVTLGLFCLPLLSRVLSSAEEPDIPEQEPTPVRVVEPPPPPEPELFRPDTTPSEPAEQAELPALRAPPPENLPLAELDFSLPRGPGSHDGLLDHAFALRAGDFQTDLTFSLDEVDERPQPRSQPRPSYPYSLRRAGISGEVVLLFVITREGRVEEVEVESTDHPDFVRTAKEAVRRWRYEPARMGGEPVSVLVRTSLSFSLQ